MMNEPLWHDPKTQIFAPQSTPFFAWIEWAFWLSIALLNFTVGLLLVFAPSVLGWLFVLLGGLLLRVSVWRWQNIRQFGQKNVLILDKRGLTWLPETHICRQWIWREVSEISAYKRGIFRTIPYQSRLRGLTFLRVKTQSGEIAWLPVDYFSTQQIESILQSAKRFR